MLVSTSDSSAAAQAPEIAPRNYHHQDVNESCWNNYRTWRQKRSALQENETLRRLLKVLIQPQTPGAERGRRSDRQVDRGREELGAKACFTAQK